MTEVTATAAVLENCFEMEVASTACSKDLPFGAAVDSTDDT